MKRIVLTSLVILFVQNIGAQTPNDLATQKKAEIQLNEEKNTKQNTQSVLTKNAEETKDITRKLDSLGIVFKTATDSINKQFEKIAGKMVRIGVSIGYNTIYRDHWNKYQSPSIDIRDTTLKLETMDPYSIKVSTSIIVTPFVNADWVKKARLRNKDKLNYLRGCKDNIFKEKTDKRTQSGAPPKTRRLEAKAQIPKVPLKSLLGANITNCFLYLVQNVGITANINILEFNKAQSNLAFNKSMEGGIGFCLRLHDNVYVSYSNELYFSRQLRENIKAYENQKLYVDGKIVTHMNELDVNDENLFITRNIIANSFKVILIF